MDSSVRWFLSSLCILHARMNSFRVFSVNAKIFLACMENMLKSEKRTKTENCPTWKNLRSFLSTRRVGWSQKTISPYGPFKRKTTTNNLYLSLFDSLWLYSFFYIHDDLRPEVKTGAGRSVCFLLPRFCWLYSKHVCTYAKCMHGWNIKLWIVGTGGGGGGARYALREIVRCSLQTFSSL